MSFRILKTWKSPSSMHTQPEALTVHVSHRLGSWVCSFAKPSHFQDPVLDEFENAEPNVEDPCQQHFFASMKLKFRLPRAECFLCNLS